MRERSVVEITSAVAFDPNHHPLRAGLYDPLMGPVSDRDPPCEICCRRFQDCPGHAGHLELVVPVHHPLLLDEILTMLRCKCLSCHRFRLAPRQVTYCKTKFQLLLADQLEQLDQLEATVAAAVYEAKECDTDKKSSQRAAGQAMDRVLNDLQNVATQSSSLMPSSTYHKQLFEEMCKETISQLKSTKRCSNCGAFSPKLRHDSNNKIFQQACE